jgi:hypothetical protein
MRAPIGRNPCLDQAIQTRKTIVLLLFYKTITLGMDHYIFFWGGVGNFFVHDIFCRTKMCRNFYFAMIRLQDIFSSNNIFFLRNVPASMLQGAREIKV